MASVVQADILDYCTECDERQINSSEPECPVCGSALQARALSAQIENTNTEHVGTSDNARMVLDLLMGLNPGDETMFNQNGQSRNGASDEAIKGLQRFTIGDERCSALHEIALEIINNDDAAASTTSSISMSADKPQQKRLFFETQIAAFSKLPLQSAQSFGLIFGSPEEGDLKFDNEKLLEGKIVVLKRGKVSFARKSLNAQAAGAVAVVIVQNVPVWPYTMLDSKGEARGVCGDELNIPVVMIKSEDGERIKSLLSKDQSNCCDDDVQSILRVRQLDTECSICQDEYKINTVAIRLPCRHHFHEKCILSWFDKHNTCPICRFELQDNAGSDVNNNEEVRDNTYLSWFA